MNGVDIITDFVNGSVSTLIQFGIDLGIPFDDPPQTACDIAYFNGCIQWVIFVFTICIGAVNNLVRSCIGGVR
jgi:hypothetical protein